MTEEAGRHAAFILSAYGAAALVVLALVIRAIIDHRAQRRALARLDRVGAARPDGDRG